MKSKTKTTKLEQVTKHLIEKGWIDSMTSYKLFMATRLSGMIYTLIKRGWVIDSINQSIIDRNGQSCRYVKYILISEPKKK